MKPIKEIKKIWINNNNNNNSKNILLSKKILATKIFEKTEYCIDEAFKKVKKDIKNANKYIENKKQINVEKCEITEIINKKMKEDFRILQNLLIGKNYKNSEKMVSLIRRILAITSRTKYI